MENVLDREVSFFRNVKSKTPETINLHEWLTSNQYKTVVEKIRNSTDEHEQKELKSKLPAITPSGLFTLRKADSLIKHSGFICIDIDEKDNIDAENFSELKTLIKELDCVAYCGLSVSGKGYFVLIPISSPDKHKEHFKSLQAAFERSGIKIDSSCSDVSRLRFASFGDAPYINVNAKSYTQSEATHDVVIEDNKEKGRNRIEVEDLIEIIEIYGVDITVEYKDWFAIGCSIASEFGESGRDYFHRVSQFYADYSVSKTDRQYTACMSDKNQHTIGTLFWIAQKYNVIQSVIEKDFNIKKMNYEIK